jgi:hypothetical protein
MNHLGFAQSNFNSNTDYIFYIGSNPAKCGFLNICTDSNVRVAFDSNAFQAYTGPATENKIQASNIVSYIVLNTNSSASANNIDFSLLEMGFRFGPNISRFITYYSS